MIATLIRSRSICANRDIIRFIFCFYWADSALENGFSDADIERVRTFLTEQFAAGNAGMAVGLVDQRGAPMWRRLSETPVFGSRLGEPGLQEPVRAGPFRSAGITLMTGNCRWMQRSQTRF